MNKRNHFSVPEGYFEQLHNTIMEQIERKPSKTRPIFRLPAQLKYAAAISAIFIICGALYINSLYDRPLYTQAEEYSNEYIDDLLDSYPIDDYTFYTYLTSNDK